ncbi:hypothetical protein BDV26DRAFT_264201 [Aspergillus bertholletiae]|uniref:Uncharacterized protein n=1 Tax=Aspergillus bertholletiae TaxID=1226010 RepID=A0A5N7B5N3_9EURO|nr:hypothetical protein BDV26DRAFT_264201 [Aspergillus bertholletiae]
MQSLYGFHSLIQAWTASTTPRIHNSSESYFLLFHIFFCSCLFFSFLFFFLRGEGGFAIITLI